jgi:mono/diheme cytochrome c family protein
VKTVTGWSLLSAAALAATLSACTPAGGKTSTGDSVGSARAGSLEGPMQGDGSAMMGGAGGMGSTGAMPGAGVSDSMETRLRAMDGMSATQIATAFPSHRQAAGAMLSRMSADVRGRPMSPNMNWGATTDSIRQDLSHMAGLTGAQMNAAMPAYHARMTRVMSMHGQMMAQPQPRTPGSDSTKASSGTGAAPRRMGGMMGGMGGMSMMGAAAPDPSAAPTTRAAPAAAAAACPAIDQRLVDEGRAVFSGTGNCFACHGPNAKGTALAPNLTDASWLDIDGSYAAIAGLVRTGVTKPKQYSTPMPALGGAALSGSQVCAVAAYVYSLAHR